MDKLAAIIYKQYIDIQDVYCRERIHYSSVFKCGMREEHAVNRSIIETAWQTGGHLYNWRMNKVDGELIRVSLKTFIIVHVFLCPTYDYAHSSL